MRQFILFVFCLVLLNSCGNSGGEVQTLDNASEQITATGTDGYELFKAIDGSGMQHAIKKDAGGVLTEEGFFKNGVREGMWVTYHPKGIPHKIFHYVNGKLNGAYTEYKSTGGLNLLAGYKENVLHGRYAEYTGSRVSVEKHFRNGQLHVKYVEYFKNSEQPQMEAEYDNGVQEGKLRYYNEEGGVTMEYTYKNGEAVGDPVIPINK